MKITTALDAPSEELDQAEQNFVAEIRKHGWFDTHVFADAEGPGFNYSTGFWITANHPELVVFGLKHEIAHDVLWGLYEEASTPPAGTALRSSASPVSLRS